MTHCDWRQAEVAACWAKRTARVIPMRRIAGIYPYEAGQAAARESHDGGRRLCLSQLKGEIGYQPQAWSGSAVFAHEAIEGRKHDYPLSTPKPVKEAARQALRGS